MPKESTSQKLPRGYNEGDTRRAFVCSVCPLGLSLSVVVVVVVVAISNCQLSMNLQKYKQTGSGAAG